MKVCQPHHRPSRDQRTSAKDGGCDLCERPSHRTRKAKKKGQDA